MATEMHITQPTGKHTHTIVFLHGRDSTASEFADEFFESQASDNRTFIEIFPTIRWVFPATRLRHSARFNMDLSQWFDIWAVEHPEERKELQIDGLMESITSVLRIVADEMRSLPADRIFLAGISQGCATAIHALFQLHVRLGGFMGFCSWLPFQSDIEQITRQEELSRQLAIQQTNALLDPVNVVGTGVSSLETPIFLAHSIDDEVVPIANSRLCALTLSSLGMTVETHEYEDGGHWVNEPRGVDDMVSFLQANM